MKSKFNNNLKEKVKEFFYYKIFKMMTIYSLFNEKKIFNRDQQ